MEKSWILMNPSSAAAEAGGGEESEMTETKVEISLCGADIVKRVILIVGMTGVGKSTLMNMLFHNDCSSDSLRGPAPTGFRTKGVTSASHIWISSSDSWLIDTIGFGDSEMNDQEIMQRLSDLVRNWNCCIHGVIFVAKFGRLSRFDRMLMEMLNQNFDERWRSSSVLVLTHYDHEETEIEENLREWKRGDSDIIEKLETFFQNRIIVTDLGCHTKQMAGFRYGLRRQCLNQLNQEISQWNLSFGPIPRSVLEKFTLFFEIFFSFLFGSTRSKDRIVLFFDQMLQKYMREISAGECPICLKAISLDDWAKTDCRHSFHYSCIHECLISEKNTGNQCPICQSRVHHVQISNGHSSFCPPPVAPNR